MNPAAKRMYSTPPSHSKIFRVFKALISFVSQGGYTYCAVAALSLLKYEGWNKCEYMRWAFQRQAPEGGFSGRANKLVDGCYSFWQLGGIAAADKDHLMHFDHFRLQRYILATCQYASGGLLDKVGKSPDLYHTCYVLSGLHLSRLCCDSKGCDASAEALLNVSSHKVSGIVDKSTSRFVQQYAVSMNLFKAGWLMQYIQVFQY